MAVMTTLNGCFGGCFALLYEVVVNKTVSVEGACIGVLSRCRDMISETRCSSPSCSFDKSCRDEMSARLPVRASSSDGDDGTRQTTCVPGLPVG